ncbi:MAG: hypothetical protein J5554_04665 [Paludibacteraceae bacterium]|nr:hypothetical protein [Paludibacteraceae bacterium]
MQKKSITTLLFILLTLGCLSCDSLLKEKGQDMSITVQISVPEVLKSMDHTLHADTIIAMAEEMRKSRQADFTDLFVEACKSTNHSPSLLFEEFLASAVLIDDEKAIKILKKRVKEATDSTMNILRSRLESYGVVNPKLQNMDTMLKASAVLFPIVNPNNHQAIEIDTEGLIHIEMKNVKEPEELLKLLTSPGKLEFWETTEFSEIINAVVEVNKMAKELEDSTDQAEAPKGNAPKTSMDSILEKIEEEEKANYITPEEYAKNPLFAILNLNIRNMGPSIGLAQEKDTAQIMHYFNLAKEKKIFPSGIYPAWSLKALGFDDEHSPTKIFDLIALKGSIGNGKAALDGDVITDAWALQQEDERDGSLQNLINRLNPLKAKKTKNYVIDMQMNDLGSGLWYQLTKKNIGKCIAIVLDGYVCSYPRVNSEIGGGFSEITGQFTEKEAKELATILKSGRLPVSVKVIQQKIGKEKSSR